MSERFELPATFCGALRYEDPDGDLISLSTDDEVQEALRLCGDGKTLKMTLFPSRDSPAAAAPQDEAPVGKAWAGALSNVFEDKEAAAPVAALDCPSSPASVSSASGDGFEMVESDSRPASVRSSAAALESAEEEDEALQAALKASAAEEAARVAAEEAARKAPAGCNRPHPGHVHARGSRDDAAGQEDEQPLAQSEESIDVTLACIQCGLRVKEQMAPGQEPARDRQQHRSSASDESVALSPSMEPQLCV